MLTPDAIQAAAAIVGLLGTALVTWWRITKRLHDYVTAQNATLAALDKLRIQVAHSAKRTHERLDLFAKDVVSLKSDLATFSVLMHEREKDVSRLEGQLEQLSSIVIEQVGAVRESTANLAALWRTLQTLHPTQVPRRASDKG